MSELASTKDHSERLHEIDARVGKIIWIPGAVAAFAPTEELREFIEDLDENKGTIFSKLPELTRFLEEMPEDDFIVEVLCRTKGFLCLIEMAVPRYGNGPGYSFSWGYYQTTWVHVESLDELVSEAERLSVELHDKEQARALAKKGEAA